MKIKVFLTVLTLFVSFIIAPSTDGAFAQDNDPVRLESNGHYYEVIFVPLPPEGITFPEAEYRASWSSFHGVQAHLATIHIVQEQMLINDLRLDLPPYENTCWIGLHRLCGTCPWFWVTGEPLSTEDFSFWYGNEGEEGIDDWYAMMCDWEEDNSGRWGSFGNGVEVHADAYAVEYPNPPPTADAGQDQSVIVGMPVSLDGGSSSDPDGDYPLAFSWEISSKPDGSTVVLDDPSSVTPCFTPDVPGTYVITLVVSDSYGATSEPDQVTIEALSFELMIEALIDLVDDNTDIPEATKTSLTASLNTALKVLNDSNQKNDVAAINALGAFINKIEAQRGKKIPEEFAIDLIERAQDIITALSGGT